MKIYFKIISIFLVVVFSFNLMAEITHSSETNHSNLKNKFYSNQTESHPIKDVSSEHSSCQDRCQSGRCHLGHCAQVPLETSNHIDFFSVITSKYQIRFNFLDKDSPFLEGLKRPPRIS
jgi:hypothetical protein